MSSLSPPSYKPLSLRDTIKYYHQKHLNTEIEEDKYQQKPLANDHNMADQARNNNVEAHAVPNEDNNRYKRLKSVSELL